MEPHIKLIKRARKKAEAEAFRPSVHKRTFEARKYPEGSPERAELNKSVITSQYRKDYKYCVVAYSPSKGVLYKTKSEAEWFANHCYESNVCDLIQRSGVRTYGIDISFKLPKNSRINV